MDPVTDPVTDPTETLGAARTHTDVALELSEKALAGDLLPADVRTAWRASLVALRTWVRLDQHLTNEGAAQPDEWLHSDTATWKRRAEHLIRATVFESWGEVDRVIEERDRR